MRTVRVNASKSYDVIIGGDILDTVGERAREALGRTCKMAVISDDTVEGLYGERVRHSLAEAGFEVVSYAFRHGEASKNIRVFAEILEFLAQSRMTRTDCIAALGGGVPGDVAGFCAASYLRGISFIQIPTTLLAAVDSSVGGKTGIDLYAGKNLAGAFWQPELVVCDYKTLSTLPEEFIVDGKAEGIKYGVLASPELFEKFSREDISGDLEDIISECVTIKRDLVAEDEYDTGSRQLLNLGHTFGHAIEKLSEFTIPHGHAVAAGMAIAARAAVKRGITDRGTADKIIEVLEKQKLPAGTNFDADRLAEAASSDKKRRGNSITIILPERIGKCRLCKIAVDELPSVIRDGL